MNAAILSTIGKQIQLYKIARSVASRKTGASTTAGKKRSAAVNRRVVVAATTSSLESHLIASTATMMTR